MHSRRTYRDVSGWLSASCAGKDGAVVSPSLDTDVSK